MLTYFEQFRGDDAPDRAYFDNGTWCVIGNFCDTCGGNGVHHVYNPRAWDGDSEIDCPDCHGNGWTEIRWKVQEIPPHVLEALLP